MCFCQVNSFGNVVYDEYVRTVERIVDYRTRISGIRPKHMNKGRYVNIVNLWLYDILLLLRVTIYVGYATVLCHCSQRILGCAEGGSWAD
jgi:RNA exonuclease 4